MQSLMILIPIALIFVGIAIALFVWAVRADQYDDLDRSGSDILFDDDLELHVTPKNTKELKKDESN